MHILTIAATLHSTVGQLLDPTSIQVAYGIFFNKWFGSADILAHLKGQKLQRVYSSHLTQMIACLMVHGAVQQQGLTERVLQPRTIQRISLCAAQTRKKIEASKWDLSCPQKKQRGYPAHKNQCGRPANKNAEKGFSSPHRCKATAAGLSSPHDVKPLLRLCFSFCLLCSRFSQILYAFRLQSFMALTVICFLDFKPFKPAGRPAFWEACTFFTKSLRLCI